MYPPKTPWLNVVLTLVLCFVHSVPAWSQVTAPPGSKPAPLQIGIYCDGATPEDQQVAASLAAKVMATLESSMVKSKLVELTKEQYGKISSGESPLSLDYLLKVRILSYDLSNQTKTTPMKAKYKTGSRTITEKNPEHLAAQQRQAMNEFARKQINDNMEKGLLKDGLNLFSNMFSNVNNNVSQTKDREEDIYETYSYFEVYVIKTALIEFKIDLRDVKTDTALLPSPILEEEVSHSDKMVMGNADAGVEEDPLELPSNTQFAKQVSTRLAEVVQEKGTSVLQKMEAERFPVMLAVDSTPSGAMVYLDNKELGTTPLRMPNVFLGKHEVIVKLPKHQVFGKNVFIEGTEGEVLLDAKLERITQGSLRVSAYLDKTMVATVDNDFLRTLNGHLEQGLPIVIQSMDGSPVHEARTPLELTLPEGQYRVKAMLSPMYEVFDRTIRLEADSENLVDIPVKATEQLMQSQTQLQVIIEQKFRDAQQYGSEDGCNQAGAIWGGFNWLAITVGGAAILLASKERVNDTGIGLIGGGLISALISVPVLGACRGQALGNNLRFTQEATQLQTQLTALANPIQSGPERSATLETMASSTTTSSSDVSSPPSEFDKKYEALMAQLGDTPASTNLVDANGVLAVVGRGSPPVEATNPDEKQRLAKQAAISDGYRQLARLISSLKVDSTTTLKDLMVQNESIKAKLPALADLIKGASIGYARYNPDGSAEVDMGIEDALKHLSAILGTPIPPELNVKR